MVYSDDYMRIVEEHDGGFEFVITVVRLRNKRVPAPAGTLGF